MNCFNCGFDRNEWEDVTRECKARLKLTSTKGEFGYLVLVHGNIDLGTFQFVFNEHIKEHFKCYSMYESKYLIKFRQTIGDLAGYFKVYKRKED